MPSQYYSQPLWNGMVRTQKTSTYICLDVSQAVEQFLAEGYIENLSFLKYFFECKTCSHSSCHFQFWSLLFFPFLMKVKSFVKVQYQAIKYQNVFLRECVDIGTAGTQTCRSLEHHLLHPTDFEAFSAIETHRALFGRTDCTFR